MPLKNFEEKQNIDIGYGEEDGNYLIEFPSDQLLAIQYHLKAKGFFEEVRGK